MSTAFNGAEIQTHAHNPTPEQNQARADADKAAADKAAAAHVTIEAGEGSGFEGSVGDGNASRETNTADKPTRPAYVPEKFWNAETGTIDVEGLAKSYGELERGRTKPADQAAEGDADPAADASADAATDSVVARAAAEFEQDGQLSDATYDALAEQGIDRATVDNYVAGIQAQQLLAYTAVGGEDNYGKMVQWAASHLTESELTAYNEAVGSGDPNAILAAVQGLNSRFAQERSVEPGMLEGGRPVTIEGFSSSAEMKAAMADPRYRKDEAFRQEVMRKIDAATKAGVRLF